MNPEFWAGVFCGGLGLSCLVVLGLLVDYAERMSCENRHD